jgi:hypothetical protein
LAVVYIDRLKMRYVLLVPPALLKADGTEGWIPIMRSTSNHNRVARSPLSIAVWTAAILILCSLVGTVAWQHFVERRRGNVPASHAVLPRWFQSGGQDYAASPENDTPFPDSELIVDAQWTTPRYYPNADLQHADIIPVTWASDGFSYTTGDDGSVGPVKGTTVIARIDGTPPADNTVPDMDFQLLAHDPFTFGCPKSVTPQSCYSIGLTNVNGVFYADTFEGGYPYPSVPGYKNGYARMEYSVGKIAQNSWVQGSENFPKPVDSGVLSFVEIGRGEASHDGCPESKFPHGCVYAIVLQDGYRTKFPLDLDQFNANQVYLARMAVGTPENHYQEIADPRRWQWFSGFDQNGNPTWLPATDSQLPQMIRSISYPRKGMPGCAAGTDVNCRFWNNAPGKAGHMNYPHMAWDAALHRYFLTFTDWYYRDYNPPSENGPLVQGGAEGVVLEAPHPWGPWSFVARIPYLGSGNGYSPSFPVQWMSPMTSAGQDLWMVWAANFAQCGNPRWVPADQCQGVYGMNLRRLHLTLAATRGVIRRPWFDQDIGFASPGNASVHAGTITIDGNGSLALHPDPFSQYHDRLFHDAFHYVFQRVEGNGAIQAEIQASDGAFGSGSGADASAGLMIREASYVVGETNGSLKGRILSSGDIFNENAHYAYLGVRKDGVLFLQYRDNNQVARVKLLLDACAKGCTLKISREGNGIHAWYSVDGRGFKMLGSHDFIGNLNRSAMMGMVATSDSSSTFPQYAKYKAAFSRVQVMKDSVNTEGSADSGVER